MGLYTQESAPSEIKTRLSSYPIRRKPKEPLLTGFFAPLNVSSSLFSSLSLSLFSSLLSVSYPTANPEILRLRLGVGVGVGVVLEFSSF